MKKKTLIIIAIAALVFACGVVGAVLLLNHSAKDRDEETVRQLLLAINHNIDQYAEKGFVVSVKQVYDVNYHKETDAEDVEFSLSYEGEGTVNLSYQNGAAQTGKPVISGLLSSGNGYMAGIQKEKIQLYNKEIRRFGDQEIPRTDDEFYGIDHEFILKTDEETFFASSDSRFYDYRDETRNKTEAFCGKIDKAVLSAAVSDERVSTALSALLFLDAWEYVNQLRELADRYLKELDFSSKEAVDRFIQENGITLKRDRGSVSISFVLNSSRILSKITGRQVESIPNISGTVTLDELTGDVLYFRYDLTDCLSAMLKESGKDKTSYAASVSAFIAEGKILNKPLEDIELDREFTEYTEENKYEFLQQFSERVIPFLREE